MNAVDFAITRILCFSF